MSNRVLKKLHGNDDGLKKVQDQSESESDSIKADGANKNKKKDKKLINRFELLNNFENNSMSDTEAKEDDDKDNDTNENNQIDEAASSVCRKKFEKQDSLQSTDSLKKKKKKKKRLRNQKSIEGQLDHDDIDATVEEVNRLLGNTSGEKPPKKDESSSAKGLKRSLLCIEYRHLNPENEMKRFFGTKVIQAEHGSNRTKRGRGRSSLNRSWILVNPKNWQNVGKSGLTMDHLETIDNIHYFTLVHSKSYQSAQFKFLEAVESFNPDNLVAILNMHPFHVDTLIQFSDVCKMGEDHQMAAELIERALHCVEHAFHPLFNLTQANCRLDYKRPENRSFYIALFKHLTFVGQRGCNRTALEFCKLLLGLDPDGDPLCVLLMIDFYAIRCEQFDYLINLYKEWDSIKKLSLLPNFQFSIALSLFLKHKNSNEEQILNEASEKLQEALIMFPETLFNLTEKCGIEPDNQVKKCQFFNCDPQKTQQPIHQLILLYVGRSHMLWKDKDVMFWLENNVKTVISRVQNNDPLVNSCKERKKKYFSQPTPRNVLRHVILSGIKEATTALPSDLSHTPIFGFDPLPPLDSITSYSRPKPKSPQTVENDRGMLTTFLTSWLPNFNEDLARNLGREQAEGQGAVAREPGDTNELRRSVTSLLDAMRDLLSNFQMVDVQNEGDASSEDEGDN